MAVNPVGHRVMVKLQKLEDVDPQVARMKSLGFEFAEQEKRKEESIIDTATVVALGATAFKDFGGDPWCEVGDLIAYARFSGKRVKDPVDQTEYLILNDEDVIAVLKENK